MLLPENNLTHEAKNHRPMSYIYTDIIENFLKDQCFINDIIAFEQTGDKKKSSLGFSNQL